MALQMLGTPSPEAADRRPTHTQYVMQNLYAAEIVPFQSFTQCMFLLQGNNPIYKLHCWKRNYLPDGHSGCAAQNSS